MALSIVYWAKYVEGHTKLTRKSEASVESGRVLRFVFDDTVQPARNLHLNTRHRDLP